MYVADYFEQDVRFIEISCVEKNEMTLFNLRGDDVRDLLIWIDFERELIIPFVEVSQDVRIKFSVIGDKEFILTNNEFLSTKVCIEIKIGEIFAENEITILLSSILYVRYIIGTCNES